MKDNFSNQSDLYAKYRPTYPHAFFDYLNTIVANRQNAWDCGTGNGQVAAQLAVTFNHVFATDISAAQLENAAVLKNITYTVQPAEQTNFPDAFFDLIVIAQAIHWFDFEAFYREVQRTSKKDALIMVIGYGLVVITPEIDAIITDFYQNVIGSYWDAERRYIDENYLTIPFPFEEITTPEFSNTYDWTFEHLIGYLNTWSAVKHFIKANDYNPVDWLSENLNVAFGNGTREVNFPLLLRIGKIGEG